MSLENELRRLDIATLDLILKRVVDFPDAPRVTLLLEGGHQLQGLPLRVERGMVLLHLVDAPSRAEVAYVPLTAIKALGLRLAEPHLAPLSSGRIRWAEGEAPGRLQLERQALEVGAASRLAVTLDWTRIPDEDEARWIIADTMAILARLLAGWAEDASARAAIEARIDGLRLGCGVKAGAAIEGRELVITVDRSPEEDGLRKEMERCL
ncbi:MAG TPA: hypothetical protein VKT70_11920 [Stellaceae bacterium]|nr:hypothetical protein [Stellaceae bacterium]